MNEAQEIEKLFNMPSNQQGMTNAEIFQIRLLLVIAKALTSDELLPALAAPCNTYGENFAVALQERLVQGQRGISQY